MYIVRIIKFRRFVLSQSHLKKYDSKQSVGIACLPTEVVDGFDT